jgi:Pyridoxamine 5'-phosphate oxidase
MTTTTKHEEVTIEAVTEHATRNTTPTEPSTSVASLTSQQIWQVLEKGSFGIISYVTPTGQPRSSGVMYKAQGHRLYVVVAPESWKARHIALHENVAMTVPVRRGGLLSLLFPIPPATISFHGTALVHAGDLPQVDGIVEQLGDLLPAERRSSSSILEITPEGSFVTYGIDVALNAMRDPKLARARVPVR